MGRIFMEFLPDDKSSKFVCASCNCDVASYSGLIWEGFMGAQQPAYLFRSTVNVETAGGPRQERLSTGMYTLVDVRCRACSTTVGWKYVKAANEDQKYKEGGTLVRQELLKRINVFPERKSCDLARP